VNYAVYFISESFTFRVNLHEDDVCDAETCGSDIKRIFICSFVGASSE
jgi:hypothetical protein